MDAKIGFIQANDGVKLHYQHWIPKNSRALLFFIHGMGDHCGRYGTVVRHFLERDYIVALYDHRGHGKSGGRRSYAEHFGVFVEDLERFVHFSKTQFPAVKHHFIAGHSFGGQLLLNFISHRPLWFHAFVALSPNIELAFKLPDWKVKLAKKVLPVWPTLPLYGGVKPEMLSRDPNVVAAYRKDPLVFRYVTARFGYEIVANQNEVLASLPPMIATPGLFLHGTADQICSWRGTEKFYQKIPISAKRLKLFEGWYHELLNEAGKGEILAEMESWFHRYLR